MPHAVVLRPDETIARRVVTLWERLYVAGIDPALLLPGTEPILPMAVFPDDVPTNVLQRAVRHLSNPWRALPCCITGIGIFGGLSPTIYLTVAPTTALLRRQGQLHALLADCPCADRYRTGRWTPGIIVSESAPSVAHAVRCLLPTVMEPMDGTLVSLELIEWPWQVTQKPS
jgi:hypothetical protein